MNNVIPIFRFLTDQVAAGRQAVLVTLTSVTGASTRNPGAHMVVAEDGNSIGSFSGGCIETAVIAEALEVMGSDRSREVRFGAGSKYLDIRLPCGGGIDLLFNPVSEPAIAGEIFDIINGRHPLALTLGRQSDQILCQRGTSKAAISVSDDLVEINHLPAAKIIILGHGPSVNSLAGLAGAYGIECAILSPDPEVIAQAENAGTAATLLKTPAASDQFQPDPWTACVFYFHDHDWEPALMKQALSSPAFHVGAMGSMKTHEARKQLLTDVGVTDDQIDRMAAPIGLIPSTRDPATLALSTLAEIVEQYHRTFGAS